MSGNSQIVEKLNLNVLSKESIEQHVIDFWKNTHDENSGFPIVNISDLCIINVIHIANWDCKKGAYPIYVKISPSFFKTFRDSNNVIRKLAHTSKEIEQLLLINNGFLYLIDMRNPLKKIEESIFSITDFSDVFIDTIIPLVKNLHWLNWETQHEDTLPDSYIDEDGFMIINYPKYDPNSW